MTATAPNSTTAGNISKPAAAAPDNSSAPDTLGEMFAPKVEARNLYQKLASVQAGLPKILATGTNQFAGKAISIGDVEDALRAPLATMGVITRWSYADDGLKQIDKALWQAHLVVRLVNSDDPTDCFEDEWVDIGGNPMAATSFARKGYLKALFHLSEEKDEQGQTATERHPHETREPGERSPVSVADEALQLFDQAKPLEQRWAIVRAAGFPGKGHSLNLWVKALSVEKVVNLRNALYALLNPAEIDSAEPIPFA